MSAANVEFIRGLYAGMGALPNDELLATLEVAIPEFCDPDLVFIETPERVDSRTYRGHEGVLAAGTRWLDQWGEYEEFYEEAAARVAAGG
jgi:hypothetical protein